MSTKAAEKRAFKRLCKIFPEVNCSLCSWYTSWADHEYYVTVNCLGSNIGEGCKSADEAVDSFIFFHEKLEGKICDDKGGK